MIGRDAEVRCTSLKHLHHSAEDAGDGSEWTVTLLGPPIAIEVTEQLVGAVDQMNDHPAVLLSHDDAKHHRAVARRELGDAGRALLLYLVVLLGGWSRAMERGPGAGGTSDPKSA